MFPLGLPGQNLGLFTGELALVVLAVVELSIVCLDRVEEEIAVLFQERVNRDVKAVEVWEERIRIGLGERGERVGGWGCVKLVKESS